MTFASPSPADEPRREHGADPLGAEQITGESTRSEQVAAFTENLADMEDSQLLSLSLQMEREMPEQIMKRRSQFDISDLDRLPDQVRKVMKDADGSEIDKAVGIVVRGVAVVRELADRYPRLLGKAIDQDPQIIRTAALEALDKIMETPGLSLKVRMGIKVAKLSLKAVKAENIPTLLNSSIAKLDKEYQMPAQAGLASKIIEHLPENA